MIKREDIKIMHSQRDTDFDDAGGMITGRELISNKSNALFPGVDDVERTTGKISLRKIYVAVHSYGDQLLDEEGNPLLGTDGEPIIVPETLMSSSLIVDSKAEDEKIHGIIFSTKDWADTRQEADDYIVNYLIKASRINGQILERQVAGQKNLRLAMKPEDRPPSIGDTLCLVQDEDKPSEIEQYVRISRVESEIRIVRVQGVPEPIPMQFVTCEITTPLRYDFDGGPITIYDDVVGRAIARETAVVDAARYYGVKELTKDAKFGDMKVQLESVYGQIVPANESNISITDAQAGTDLTPSIKSGGVIHETLVESILPRRRFYLSGGILPNSLEIEVSGTTLTDRNGHIMNGDVAIGTVDYARGILLFGENSPTYNGRKSVRYIAAAAPFTPSNSDSIPITTNNRYETYNRTLLPIPEPGALIVSYRSLDNWYTLRDKGSGELVGDLPGSGVGTVSYTTGTVSLSLAALPDADSEIIFTWGTATTYYDRASDAPLKLPTIKYELERPYVQPSTLTLTWREGDEERLAKDNGSGLITGDIGGEINYSEGILELKPSRLLSPSTVIHAEYKSALPDLERTKTFVAPNLEAPGNGFSAPYYNLTLDDKEIVEGSIIVEFNLEFPNEEKQNEFGGAREPNSHGPQFLPMPPLAKTYITTKMANSVQHVRDLEGRLEGYQSDINYEEGRIRFVPIRSVTGTVDIWSRDRANDYGASHWGFEYVTRTARAPVDGTQYVTVRYLAGSDVETVTEELTLDTYYVDINPYYNEDIVPNSVRLRLGERIYIDRDGSLYTDIDELTGAGRYAGTINYNTGEAQFTLWEEGIAPSLRVESLLTVIDAKPITEIVFRTPSAPVATNGLQIVATRLNGTQITGVANADGEIVGDGISGSINYQTGVVRIDFGKWDEADNYRDEEWFDPSLIFDEKIFLPNPVLAPTVRYNAVLVASMPVDEAYIGIDTVRLPSNGKVPLYRKGELVVLHRLDEHYLPDAPPMGLEILFNDTRINEAWLEDRKGVRIPCEQYEVDRVAGVLCLTNNNFVDYEWPVKAVARIEDQLQIADVQVNGELTFNRPLSHDYPAGSLCSSMLFFGDLQARYRNIFTQSYWDGVYRDYRESGQATNWQYNDTEYPIKLTNADAVQQRWAIVFDTKTTFKVYGEHLGQVAIGSTNADLAPINPNTGNPYFTLLAAGWGQGGQEPNDVLRFNTLGANHPVWIARTVEQSEPTNRGDQFTIRARGHINIEEQ